MREINCACRTPSLIFRGRFSSRSSFAVCGGSTKSIAPTSPVGGPPPTPSAPPKSGIGTSEDSSILRTRTVTPVGGVSASGFRGCGLRTFVEGSARRTGRCSRQSSKNANGVVDFFAAVFSLCWWKAAQPPAIRAAIIRLPEKLQRFFGGRGGLEKLPANRPRPGSGRVPFLSPYILARSFLVLCLAWTLLSSAIAGRRSRQFGLLIGTHEERALAELGHRTGKEFPVTRNLPVIAMQSKDKIIIISGLQRFAFSVLHFAPFSRVHASDRQSSRFFGA